MTGWHVFLIVVVCLLAGGFFTLGMHKKDHPDDNVTEMGKQFGIGVGIAAAGLVAMAGLARLIHYFSSRRK